MMNFSYQMIYYILYNWYITFIPGIPNGLSENLLIIL